MDERRVETLGASPTSATGLDERALSLAVPLSNRSGQKFNDEECLEHMDASNKHMTALQALLFSSFTVR